MRADPDILQMKYADVIKLFSENAHISLDKALQFFYRSETYRLMRDGISDMHCMSDAYLAEDLMNEYRKNEATLPKANVTQSEGLTAFEELRKQCADVSEMSLEEINAEIAEARKKF